MTLITQPKTRCNDHFNNINHLVDFFVFYDKMFMDSLIKGLSMSKVGGVWENGKQV